MTDDLDTQVTHTVEEGCKICASLGPHPAYKAQEMMFGLGDQFEYFQCIRCGCLQIVEIPTDLAVFYPVGYYAHKSSPEERFANPLLASLLRAKGRYAISGQGILGRVLFERAPDHDVSSLRLVHPEQSSSILDVGCGNGKLLYLLRELGYSNLFGIDPFIERSVTYGNGLRIDKRFLSEAAGVWDIVMFHHAFEHMSEPLEALLHVRRLLKPSGVCIIRIPKSDSYAWRHYRRYWVQLDAPRHFFLHSQASIEHLAAKSGLRVTGVVDDSTEFQFMGSELYKRGIPHKDYSRRYGDFFEKSEILDFRTCAKILNKLEDGDSAAFYLSHAENQRDTNQ